MTNILWILAHPLTKIIELAKRLILNFIKEEDARKSTIPKPGSIDRLASAFRCVGGIAKSAIMLNIVSRGIIYQKRRTYFLNMMHNHPSQI